MKRWFYANGKRIGAFTLVFALVLSLCFPGGLGSLLTALADESAAWDGTTADSYAGGSGTKADPYQIATAEQLARLVTATDTAGQYYKLTRNIRLNESGSSEPKQWVTSGSEKQKNVFQGYLEGNGYKISGLYIHVGEEGNEAYYAGLFNHLGDGTTIRNVGIVDADIAVNSAVTHEWGNTFAGTLAGIVDNASSVTIVGCYADESVSVTARVVDSSFAGKSYNTGAGGFVGGAVGKDVTLLFNNCFFTGALSCSLGDGASAFCGNTYNPGMSIVNCYTINNTVHRVSADSLKNVYATAPAAADSGVTILTKDQMTGDAAKDNMPALDWDTVWSTAADKTPQLRVIAADYQEPEEETNMGTPGEVWSGKVAAGYADGDGSRENPYQIATGEQLARLVTSKDTAGKYYKLTQDILLNDTSASNWTENSPQPWVIQGPEDIQFRGTLEGDGHTVSGLYINTDVGGWLYAGLFNRLGSGAVVRNVGFTKTDITLNNSVSGQDTYAGALAGYAQGGAVTISGCYGDDTVRVKTASAGGNPVGTGGLVGAAAVTTRFSDCFFTGVLECSKSERANAFCGNTWAPYESSIENCYTLNNTVYLTAPKTLTNVYSTEAQDGVTVLTEAQMTGDAAKTSMSAFDWDTVWIALSEKTPQLRAFGFQEKPENVWDGTTASDYAGGSGTETDPYQIATGEQLAKLVTSKDTAGKYYKLTNDICLNDTSAPNWKENSPKQWVGGCDNDHFYFSGTLEGDGHIVSGLYINGKTDWFYGGLFNGLGNGAVIRNVGLTNASVTGENAKADGPFLGTLAGNLQNNSTVNVVGCWVDDTVTVKATNSGSSNSEGAGGFIGCGASGMSLTFSNCYFTGTVACSDPTAATAFCGSTWGGANATIVNCYTVGSKVCRDSNDSTKNVYATAPAVERTGVTILTENQMTGSEAQTAMPALDWKTVWSTAAGKTPQLRVIAADYQEPEEEANMGTPGEVWSGKVAAGYAGGDGSESNPYQIATGEQLARLATSKDTAGKYYQLTHDILLNDTSSSNWLTSNPQQWVTSANMEIPFAGTLEGSGHTVSGLYISLDVDGYYHVGLFNKLGNANIRNVGIVNASITVNNASNSEWAETYAGTLAGSIVKSSAVTIIGCYADESVSIKTNAPNTKGVSTGSGGFIGGTGASTTMLFNNCYFTGKLESSLGNGANAFCGNTWSTGMSILNSYTVGSKVYRSNPDKVKYVYGTEAQTGVTVLTKDQMTGDAAKTNMPGLDWKRVWSAAAGKTPQLGDVPADWEDPNIDEGVPGRVWSGKEASGYAGGSGTRDDPYRIATPEQLALLANETAGATAGKYYKLTQDIKLNNSSADNWTKTARQWFITADYQNPTFCGTLEGDGHTISGLYIEQNLTDDNYVGAGLFKSLGNGAVIRNLGFTNTYIALNGNAAGAFAGTLSGYAPKKDGNKVTVTGCWADDTVFVKAEGAKYGAGAGGFIGAGDASMDFSNCYFTGKVECSDETAATAFCGSTWTGGLTIKNCYTVGSNAHRASDDVLKNVYGTVSQSGVILLTVEQMTGSAAKTNMPKLDWDAIWKTEEGKTPQLKGVPSDYQDPSIGDGTPGAVWTGKTSPTYAGGDGTKESPYLISTAEQLARLLDTVLSNPSETAGKYYKLTDDILLNDTSAKNWEETANQWYTSGSSSSCFQGNFDGDGHVVKGLYVNQSAVSGNIYAGLFPVVKHGSTIKNVGLSQSHINIFSENGEAFAGGITAYVHLWKDEENIPASDYPVIEGCFGDTTVTIEAQFSGGILCGSPRQFTIRNCYFVGTLKAYGDRAGGIVGNAWYTKPGATVTNCYAATTDENSATGVNNPAISYSNTYSTAGSINGIFALSLNSMRGDLALERMKGFDFDQVWKVLDNGTPVLRKFNSDNYTNTNPGRKVKISFVSNGGTELEPIYGDEGEKIAWPEVSRYGYKFEGWYVYPELDVRFKFDVFPMFDITLYANWTETGIEQGFESYPHNNEDGMGSDYQYFRPGVLNYSADMVHGGGKAIVRLGEVDEEQDLLLFGDELGRLTVGQEYDLTFWIYTDEINAKPTLKLGYTNYPDVIEPAFAYAEIPLTEALPSGEWQQVHYTFIASSPYLVFRTPGMKMVLDDFHIVPTGQSGEPDVSNPSSSGGNASPSTGEVAVTGLIAMAAVLSVCIMVALRSRKRRCVK